MRGCLRARVGAVVLARLGHSMWYMVVGKRYITVMRAVGPGSFSHEGDHVIIFARF